VSKSKTPNQFKKTRGVVVETTTFCVVSATQLTLRTTETTETFSFGFWLHPPETAFTLSHTKPEEVDFPLFSSRHCEPVINVITGAHNIANWLNLHLRLFI